MELDIRSRFLRIKSKVPVYRLFLEIFLWFWLTGCAILAIVLLGNQLRGIRTVSAPNMYATVAPILASEAARSYETGGAAGFKRFALSGVSEQQPQMFLLDDSYRDVLSRPLVGDSLKVAKAAKPGQLITLRDDIASYRFVSDSGKSYILLFYRRSGLVERLKDLAGADLPYTLGLLALVALLCFALAYHIASPIRSIQTTARRVAQGDLSARVPAHVSKRFDELAALAKDFDSMVCRLDLVIEGQKSLLNSVSHELRSPLARINLALAFLRRDANEDAEGMFQRLDREITRIDMLIGQLLTLSRLETRVSLSDLEDVDFSLLVEEAAANGNFEAEASGSSVYFRPTEPVILAKADPHSLRSACENVIRNAIRFTAPGTTVEVSLDLDETLPNTSAVMTVRDYGPGVPQESLEAIFQPFYRVPPHEASKGNGLGLTIALEAIRIHGGTICAANRSPSGLEIELRLPLKRP